MAQQDDAAKLLALGLLNFADDEGYFYADPKLIRSALRPFDDDSSIVRRSLDHLERIGYIKVREHPTHGAVGLVLSFDKHQRVDRPKSSEIKSLYDSTIDRRLIDDDSSLEGKGRDQGSGNGKEGNPPLPPKGDSWEPDELQLQVSGWFNRRPTTPWNDKEKRAWRKVDKSDESISDLNAYYTAEIPDGEDYRRHDLVTLLNNWNGEIDRAKAFISKSKASSSAELLNF